MQKGYSLHVGLDYVNPDYYDGNWTGKLFCCVNDAKAMLQLAKQQGFEKTKLLTNEKAIRKNIVNTLKKYARDLVKGDLLFISYSGHGGSVLDLNGDEDDGYDETFCLYDGDFLDDEMHEAFALFKKDVRILFVADCCHSGTVVKNGREDVTYNSLEKELEKRGYRPRTRPKAIGRVIRKKRKDFFEQFRNRKIVDLSNIGANVLQLGACQDNQKAYEGDDYGMFTGRLLNCWDDGNLDSNYDELHKEILLCMPRLQNPTLYLTGSANKNFLNQKPFSIQIEKTNSYVPKIYKFLSQYF